MYTVSIEFTIMKGEERKHIIRNMYVIFFSEICVINGMLQCLYILIWISECK